MIKKGEKNQIDSFSPIQLKLIIPATHYFLLSRFLEDYLANTEPRDVSKADLLIPYEKHINRAIFNVTYNQLDDRMSLLARDMCTTFLLRHKERLTSTNP
jgi:hypothetical protein